MNLPRVVTSVGDGQDFYYVQANVAVELDQGTTTLIRARHAVIDRHLLKLLRTYRVQDLRVVGQRSVREDMKRVIGHSSTGEMRYVYFTN